MNREGNAIRMPEHMDARGQAGESLVDSATGSSGNSPSGGPASGSSYSQTGGLAATPSVKPPNRYVILFSAAACLSISGAIYIWSIFNLPLAQAHGWQVSEVSFAYSLFLVVSSVSFILAGSVMKRVKPNVLMLAAGLSVVAGWLIAGAAQSIAVLYLGFGVIAGFADGFVYNAALSTAQAWFPDRRGFASGVCVGAVGLVPVAFAPLGNFLIETFDVQMSFTICALLFLCIFVAFGPRLRMPADGWMPDGWDPAQHTVASGVLDLNARQALARPLFWLMWIFMLAATSAGLMLSAHTSNIGQHMVGMTASQGAVQVAILSLSSFAGRLGFGTLSDRIGRCLTIGIAMAITALDLLVLFPVANDFVLFSAALAISGACFGGVMAVMPALCADVFGSTHFAQNYAWMYSGYTTSALIGPTLAVRSFEATGSYLASFQVAGVVALVALALAAAVHACILRALRSRE